MDRDDSALWAQLFTEIAIINQLASTATQRLLPPPLSLAGYGVLNHLARLPSDLHGDWGPARLARAFQVTKGAMTNTLQRLEAAGLITQEADPDDGRARFVRLTPAGLAARDTARAAIAPQIAGVAAAFPAEQAAAALSLLAVLRDWLDKQRDAPHSGTHD